MPMEMLAMKQIGRGHVETLELYRVVSVTTGTTQGYRLIWAETPSAHLGRKTRILDIVDYATLMPARVRYEGTESPAVRRDMPGQQWSGFFVLTRRSLIALTGWSDPAEYAVLVALLEAFQCELEGRATAAEFTTVVECDEYLTWVVSKSGGWYPDIETTHKPFDYWEAYKATQERKAYLLAR